LKDAERAAADRAVLVEVPPQVVGVVGVVEVVILDLFCL
jgi:hypothetical protein